MILLRFETNGGPIWINPSKVAAVAPCRESGHANIWFSGLEDDSFRVRGTPEETALRLMFEGEVTK